MTYEAKVRPWLLIVLLAVIIIGGVFIYGFANKCITTKCITDPKTSPTPTLSTAKKSPSPSPTASDITIDWKTYKNESFGVTFKYPKDWATPKETTLSKEQNELTSIGYTNLNWGFDPIQSVQLSYYENYESSGNDYARESYTTSLNKIKNVYQTKNPSGAEKLWLPPSNAAIMASTKPEYIQTADGKYRGIFFFAPIGQDSTMNIDIIIILTDGQSKIIQFHFENQNPAKKAEYEMKGFGVNTAVVQEYYNYISTLTSKSTDEPIVREFNDTYKNMTLSIQNL